jgi:hypothetical protein
MSGTLTGPFCAILLPYGLFTFLREGSTRDLELL